jgi:predicted metalloprotease
MTKRLPALTVTVALAVCFALFGSGAAFAASPQDPPTVTPTEATAPRGIVTTSTTLDEFLVSMVTNVDAYWSDVWDADGLPTPVVNYAFPLAGETVATLCTETGRTTDISAYYCPADDTIVVSQLFANRVFEGAIKANPDQTMRYPTGDFSIAFVIAHEYAHSLQAELGWITPSTMAYPGYKIELHADCWAGVWANSAYVAGILETGDVEEAVQTTLDLGDYYISDPSHHGTPAQRSGAFLTGYNTGLPGACDPYLRDVY